MLKNKIEKKKQLKIRHKKQLESTQVNLWNAIPESCGQNNIIKNKQNKS
jgi:hypothetical protein